MSKASSGRPKSSPPSAFPSDRDKLHQQGAWLWLPLKKEWRNVASKPEEVVRQFFIRHLHENLGYALEQMDQERKTQHGHRSPRADIVVWASAADMAANPARTPVLVIECKAEAVEIDVRDYWQGESYTRATGCEFFVATNRRFTAILKLVRGAPGEFVQINEFPRASDWGDVKRIEEIRRKLRVFDRREFQGLLSDCHDILRDVHKMEPGRAFDAISKVLFIKMFIERTGAHGTFTTDFLDQRAATRLPTEAPVHDSLFEQTKAFFAADELFTASDKLDISEETFRRIVKKLERFDLSRTSDDIKGLAFEQFLGDTFRSDLGQFFTPHPVVDFMVEMLDPKEGDLTCDPAAGSGGFLIRTFEHVRAKIAADLHERKMSAKAEIEKLGLPEEEEVARIEQVFADLNRELLPSNEDGSPAASRVGRLAWQCVFGCDAETRAARTAKMNMIMHGDGHGGIYHHDGFVDVGGIFSERFDLVLTDPPFGATVGGDQRVGDSNETRVLDDPAYRKRCEDHYGAAWRESYERALDAARKRTRILDMFKIGSGKASRATEILFVERCLSLLKPGGRMSIVLPDGNLNNPSRSWLRRWCEGKARILAVVSLPDATFRSADATVKASVVFMRRFTEAEATAWEEAWANAHAALDPAIGAKREEACRSLESIIVAPNAAAAAVARLAEVGMVPEPLGWSGGEPPHYPRGARPTKPGRLSWAGKPTNENAAKAAFREYRAAVKADQRAVDLALRELQARLRAADDEHTGALWREVRRALDYPVFMAAPPAVGITGTGETGDDIPNDLPDVLARYREFAAWIASGMEVSAAPEFAQ